MGFTNAVVGGAAALIRAAIKSPNYVTGSAGWSINKDGSAEFSNLTIRGTFDGTDLILNSAGLFLYSGTPAAGNLLFSSAPDVTTADGFGNAIPNGGATSYANAGLFWSAVNIGDGAVQWYKAATEAGPWTAETSLGFTFNALTGGGLNISAPAGISGALVIPQSLSGSIQTLNNDNNSGSSWVSGERAFMNNSWVAPINSNFNAIVAALAAAGIAI